YAFQEGAPLKNSDVRVGATHAQIDLILSDRSVPLRDGAGARIGAVPGAVLSYSITGTNVHEYSIKPPSGQAMAIARPGSTDPDHLLHPIFSGRFNGAYQQASDINAARQVWPTDQNIIARVKQIASADIAEGRQFRELSQNVLGVTFEALDT